MTIISKGRDLTLMNVALNSTTDVQVDIQSGYTPLGTSGANSGNIVQQVGNVSSIIIQCRTAVDMQLRKTSAATNFFTIKSGTVFNLDIDPIALGAGQIPPFFLRSGTGNVTAEIMLLLE